MLKSSFIIGCLLLLAAPAAAHPPIVYSTAPYAVVQPAVVMQPAAVVVAVPAVQVVPVQMATVHHTRYPLRGGPRGLFGIRGRTRDRAYLDMALRSHAAATSAVQVVPLVVQPAVEKSCADD